jgi:thioredoxin-related protein
MKLILATAKFCGPCAQLKNKLKTASLEVDSMELESNIEFFQKHGIKSVPRLVVLNENDELIETIQGMDDIITKIKNHAKDQNVS